jgi:hypothetical protein
MKLYNYENDLYEDIDDDGVEEKLFSGSYGIPKGTKLHLEDSEGQVVEMDSSEAVKAIGSGTHSFVGADRARAREMDSKYGDGANELKAHGEQVLRSLSLGISDPILANTISTKEDIEGRKEANAEATALTDVVTTAGTLLLNPANAFKKLTPLGVVDNLALKLGTKTGKAVEKVLSKTTSKAGLIGAQTV